MFRWRGNIPPRELTNFPGHSYNNPFYLINIKSHTRAECPPSLVCRFPPEANIFYWQQTFLWQDEKSGSSDSVPGCGHRFHDDEEEDPSRHDDDEQPGHVLGSWQHDVLQDGHDEGHGGVS